MAYDTSSDSGAQDEGSQDQPGEDQSSESGYTCFLPSDFPGADSLKAGDTITMKVIGKDKDGDLEVEHMPSSDNGSDNGDKMSMMDDLDQTMS